MSPNGHSDRQSASGAIFPVCSGGEPRFNVIVHTVDRLIAALRRCCQSLPDRRIGRNLSYAMADFAIAAFAPFFMQSPSFLAHQRHLETVRWQTEVVPESWTGS